MKKFLLSLCLLSMTMLQGITVGGTYPQYAMGISDSTLKYLEGDWVQSYRSKVYFLPLCELACYPKLEKCYADFYKFEVAPALISYKRLGDSSAAVIRPSGTVYDSDALNENFFDKGGNVFDTIFLKKVGSVWRVDTLRSNANLSMYLNAQMANTHFYNYFTETEKVVFERTTHRALGKYLMKYNWWFDACPPPVEQVCFGVDYPEHFYLKNDTIHALVDSQLLFTYDYLSGYYRGTKDKDVYMELSKDSSAVLFKRGADTLRTYGKIMNKTLPINNQYEGIWIDVSDNTNQLIVTDENGILTMNNARFPETGDRKLRIGYVYSDLIAVPLTAAITPVRYEPYAFLKSGDECTPSFSRFYLRSQGSELLEVYTGKVYSKITETSDHRIENEIALKSNPVFDGKLELSSSEAFQYEIFNQLGSRMAKGNSDNGSIDVDSLKTGSYILKIARDHGVSFVKFVIGE